MPNGIGTAARDALSGGATIAPHTDMKGQMTVCAVKRDGLSRRHAAILYKPNRGIRRRHGLGACFGVRRPVEPMLRMGHKRVRRTLWTIRLSMLSGYILHVFRQASRRLICSLPKADAHPMSLNSSGRFLMFGGKRRSSRRRPAASDARSGSRSGPRCVRSTLPLRNADLARLLRPRMPA